MILLKNKYVNERTNVVNNTFFLTNENRFL